MKNCSWFLFSNTSFFFFFIHSRTFSGGKTYDKDHVVIMLENDERPSQQWQLELL